MKRRSFIASALASIAVFFGRKRSTAAMDPVALSDHGSSVDVSRNNPVSYAVEIVGSRDGEVCIRAPGCKRLDGLFAGMQMFLIPQSYLDPRPYLDVKLRPVRWSKHIREDTHILGISVDAKTMAGRDGQTTMLLSDDWRIHYSKP